MRKGLILLIVCFVFTACDQSNSAKVRGLTPATGGGFQEDDPTGGSTGAAQSALRINTSLRSASSDGREADLSLFYTIDNQLAASISASSTLSVEYVNSAGQSRLLTRVAANSDQLQDEIQVTVPTDDINAAVRVSLGGVRENVITGMSLNETISLPSVIRKPKTDLSLVEGQPVLSLVEGSYSSEVLDGRRLHRFAVRVDAPLEGQSDEGLSPITGLETEVSQHFKAYEFNSIDSESFVTASYAENQLAVYLVIDVSGSIVSSRQAHNLLDAVARSVIALAPNAEFDYRVFANDVYRINSLRDINFDEPRNSGTALYYSVDTALVDIENYGADDQDKIMVVFTDGDDRASRNFYPAFLDHEQVFEYLNQRITNVSTVQDKLLERQFHTYFVSFDQSSEDVNEEALATLAEAGNGLHYDHITDGDIQGAFAKIVNNVRGMYYLEYSSQQTPDDTLLEISVKIGEESQRITLPTQYGKE